jgi:hypothetical protein
MKIKFIWLIISLLVFISCENKKDFNPNDKGKITIKLTNFMYNRPIRFNERRSNDERITISKLQYYLSNFKFIRADGSEFVYPKDKSYFLIKEENQQLPIVLNFEEVPAGDYIGFSFLVGVDALKSTSPIDQRTGVLNPTNNEMYWSNEQGYIFFKLEGRLVSQDLNSYVDYRFHIGGYGGQTNPSINNLQTITLYTQPEVAQVRKDLSPTIIIGADISKVYNQIDIKATPDILFTPNSLKISENYSQMFRYGYLYME